MATDPALFGRALSLHESGSIDEAEAVYSAILRDEPAHSDALHYLGVIAYQRFQFDAAYNLISKALALNPTNVVALNNRGNVLLGQRQLKAALRDYDAALAADPNYADALSNRGNVLIELGRPEEAMVAFDRALALRPDYVVAMVNRGNALLKLQRREEAIAAYDDALGLNDQTVDAHYNRANALQELNRIDEALKGYDRALALAPDYASAHWNQALCRLLTGDFQRGWEQYEWRWRTKPQKVTKREFSEPLWLGKENVSGKTVLLHAEQGFGDTLQFCRYAPLLAKRGARVVLEVQPPLKALLSTLDGVAQVIARGEELPAFDFHCPLLSLPLAFGTTVKTIPAQVPYLKAQPDKVKHWRVAFSGKPGPRVGLIWSGRAQHGNNRHRSIAPHHLTPLLDCGVTFVNLQKDCADRDREWLAAHPDILDYSDQLQDFADTAALANALDLAISVDTSVAHLAGALALPLWVMLPFIGVDWRWFLARTDSPWYPTARLFRQPAMDTWDDVIAQVAAALKQFAATRSSLPDDRGGDLQL